MMVLFLLTACGQGDRSRHDALRVAVPPVLAPALGSFCEPGQRPTDFVEMHPYGRARDLEVLLFSSGSLAFQGVVVPGRSLPSLHPWLTALSLALPEGVRPDVVRSLGGASPLAVPLTVDFGVLVVRKDVWSALALPPPSNLASLREVILILRSKDPALRSGIGTGLPVDELFWDLSWSFEGRADTRLYTFPKVHVLEFLREFHLDRTLAPGKATLEELQTGRTVALFTSLQRGLQLESEDARLAILPLPSATGKALAFYNGWCAAKLSGDRDIENGLARFRRTFFVPAAYGRLKISRLRFSIWMIS